MTINFDEDWIKNEIPRFFDGSAAQINCISYGNGKLIAVGISGRMSYSVDNGRTWHDSLHLGEIQFGTTTAWSVAYGNGRWVVVGESGKASYSDDGENWTALTPGTTTGIKFGTTDAYYVAYGNGRWIVVGASGKASYSDDGVTWTVLTAGTVTGIKFGTTGAWSVAYGNGRWVVVGNAAKASLLNFNSRVFIAVGNALIDTWSNFLEYGYFRNDAWTLTIPEILYVDYTNDGEITGDNTKRIIGNAHSGVTIYFNPSKESKRG